MAVSASINSFKQHIARVTSAALLTVFTLISMPSHAQWTPLTAPGQSTRAVATQPTVLAIAKSARILVVGHSSQSVAFYHPDTATLLGTTTLPTEPVAVALSDDGTQAFALFESGGIKIAVIDTATRAVTATWSTTGSPVGMVLNGTELLVADKSALRLVGISATTGVVTRTQTLSKEPLMIGIGAAGSLVLVGVKTGELQLLNSSNLTVIRTVTVGDDIRSLAWWEGDTGGTGSGRVLAVGKTQNALNLVDPATGSINRVALGGDPNTVGIEQHNHWAYVGEKDDQIISLIDLINRALSGYFTLPGKIGSLLFDQQGELLFVSLTADNKLLKLDPNQASLISKVGVAKTLKDVAVNSTTHEGIAISNSDADFARINLANHSVQTLVLPVKADKVVVDSSLNLAIVGATNNKLSFVNLGTTPPTLYPQTVDLDGTIKDMAVDPTRSITVAVVNDKQSIRVIDNLTRAELAAVQTPDKYVTVAIHPEKAIAYLATDNQKLSLFNLTTRTVTQTVPLSFAVEGIAVDPALNRAVLTTKDQSRAWILNLDTLQMVASVPMPINPGAVAIQTDTHIAVVASKDTDTLSLLDLTTNVATLNFNQIGKPTSLAISNRYNEVLVVSSDKNDLAIVKLSNPAGSVNSIVPTQVTAGAGATTLTVTGAHFIDGAVVYFGTTALATTWVSPTSLTAIVPTVLLAAPGSTNIRVQNPAPAGGTSASLVFTVVVPAPVLDSVVPVSVVADNTAKTFTLSGSHFYAPVSVVVTSPTGTQTFATTAATLTGAQVTLPATLFSAAGTLTIAVQANGGTSNSKTVTLTAAAPTLAAFTPATLKANSQAQSLTVTGSNFIAPVSVRFAGTLIDATPTSATQLTVAIPGTLLTAVGTAPVSVEAAGGTSNALSINIIAPPPEPFLYSSAPATLLALNQAIPVTLSGQNFVSGAVVLLSTSAAATTTTLPANFINASQLKITIPAANTTAASTLILKVQNPDGGTSNDYSLPVTAPQLIVSAIAPARGAVGSTITIYGTGFSASAGDNVVTFAGNVAGAIQAATTTSLTVTVPTGAQTGAVQVAIGARTATTPTFTVGQTPEQDFAFGTNAAQVILYQGSSTSVDVQLNNAGAAAYTNLAKLAVTGAAAGVSAVPSRPYLSNGQAASIVLKADATAAVGTSTLTVTATGPTANGTETKTATVNVEVRSKANVTGVKGRFVDAKGMGIGGVLVRNDTNQVQTDSAGNFLLIGLPAGNLTLRFDATPAHPLFPIWPYTVKMTQGQIVTIPDWTISPPPADDKFTAINNATVDQQITDSRYPGLAIMLPAGVTITGWDGVKKSRMAVERFTPDQLPVSLPPTPIREAYQLYFGTPMGGIPSQPIPVTLPNVADLDPGEQSEIWYFDGSPMGGDGTWKIAGMGTVSPDGRTVTTNPGSGIPRFCGVCGLVTQSCPPLPDIPKPPPPPCRDDLPPPPPEGKGGGEGAGQPKPPTCKMGNPVMLATGQESPSVTDLVLGGAVPISIDRNYNPTDGFNNRAGTITSLGYGWAMGYDVALLPFAGPQKRLVLPGNNKVNFILQPDGTYLNSDDKSYSGVVMRQTAGSTTDWEVEMTDKTLMKFKPFSGITGVIRGGPPLFLVETRSPNGKVLTITRQPNGRITSAGTQERSVTMTYGANGFVSEVTDPLNRKVRYIYTTFGRIETVTDPEGGVTRYGYQPDRRDYAVDTVIRPSDEPFCSGLLTVLANPNIGIPIKSIQYPGTTGMTTNTIGPGGRVVKQVLADGSEYRFDYQLTGACRVGAANAATPIKKTVCTGADSTPCIESFDAAQQGIYLLGGEIIAVTTTDPKGRKRTIKLNAQGSTNMSEDEQGQPVTYVRDAAQRITFSKDVLGRTMRYVYDSKGNVTQTADGIGRLMVASYDAQFNKPSVITRFLENGTPINTTMQYNNLTGNMTSMSNPENNTSSYTYNARGQVLEATNPIGNKTKFEYNPAGDLIKTTDPLTNAVQATVDAAGRSTIITDPLGFATGIQYNNINQPTKLTDALLGETKLAYNTKQQLQSVTDANNHVVESYQYDDMFRVTSRTDNTGATDSYQYDPNGLLKQVTDRKGQVISQTYDEQDRPVNTSYADGTVLTRLYDAVGRLSKLTRATEAIAYSYDLVDRVTSMIVTANGKTDTLAYTYDNLNRLTQRSVNNVITSYTYDNAKRIRTITHQGQTTTYNWDAASRLTSKILPNGVTQSMQYDNANRMTQMTYRKTDNSIIEQIGYTFDARGQRTSKSTTNAYPQAEESAYAGVYDSANRLTRLTTKGTGPLVNGTATDETFNLSYDINGNMTQKSKADGSDTTNYTWDSQNRLVGLTRTGATTLTATFKYDLGNRRIEKTINGVTVKFIYDGDQIVGEQKSDGTTTSVLAGLAIDEMIARYSNGQQSTYLTDALGSVIAQLKDDQTVQNQYGYSPYGMTTKGNAGVVDNAVDDKGNASQYASRENDSTGLYYYRARYYMANCGRFISEDPIGLGGGINLYAYLDGNPTNLADPLGLAPPSLPCGLADFLTGIADSASFGIGPYIRGLYDIDGGIDTTSGFYTAGEVASLGLGLGRLGYAAIAAGIKDVPGITGIAANQMRNDLKLAARAGRFPNYRMPSYEKLAKTKTDAEIIESASRTNPGANGAGVAGAAGAVSNAIVTAAQGRGSGGCQ